MMRLDLIGTQRSANVLGYFNGIYEAIQYDRTLTVLCCHLMAAAVNQQAKKKKTKLLHG